MNRKKSFKYAIVSPTSMGTRLSPENRNSFYDTNIFYMQATSAETNVLNIASSLGYKSLAITKFIEGSPISNFIKRELRKRNIEYTDVNVKQDGPWGYRHQFNIVDPGYGLKASRVWNDRSGEVGRTLNIKDYDTKKIFEKEGVCILHISGLIASMSKDTTNTCVKLAEIAKANNTLVSFDLNYRESFWKGREEELKKSFVKIASLSDILIGNEEDFQLCLGLKGPEAGGKNLNNKIEQFKDMITIAKKKYKNTKVFATTLREVVTSSRNMWGAIINVDDKWYIEKPREIDVLDRIGGGDGFTGGLLYGIVKGYKFDKCLSLGWAAGALAVTSMNDYATPVDEKQLLDIYLGSARVQR